MSAVSHGREPISPMLQASLIARGVDAAPVAVSITDRWAGRYLYVNEAMCGLLARSADEVQRLTPFDVTHADDHVRDAEAREAMVNGTLSSYQAEKRYVRPDGTSIWVAVHVVPIRDDDGAIEAFFAQKLDITDRKQHDQRLADYVSDAEWLGRIRDALDQDRFMLYAQPIVDLRSGEVVQRELLLRMRDEDGGIVAPRAFLPVAERYGLIAEIDRWVIRQAVQLASNGTPVEFNLSAASIANSDVLAELASQIQTTGVDPSLLVVEVTETVMLDQPRAARALAEQLCALGCELALDDFGTGFATLSSLKQLPVQHLKIDIDFVRDIADDETNQRLVRAIVGVAREFELTTTAEGVEDEAALTTLRRLGVDRAQGYLFARPAPLSPARSTDPSSSPRRRPSPAESLVTVRDAFDAFTERDLVRARRVCHPALVLRPHTTTNGADRDGAFRGHDGVARYLIAVQEAWDELRVRPTGFWQANGAVIVAGEVTARKGASTRIADLLWVFRLREGLIASIQMFDPPEARAGTDHQPR